MPEKTPKTRTKPLDSSPRSAVVRTRGLAKSREIHLFVRAGGRCQFPGCNKYLLEHPLTLTPGNFAEAAHIVAFSRQGPRADAALPASYINSVDNLMLLCPPCHKLVDDHPDEHSVDRLRRHKTLHEDRIHYVTGISSNLRTMIVRFTARIGGRVPSISFSEIAQAVEPRYPLDRKGLVVDLTGVTTSGEDLIDIIKAEIRTKLAPLSSVALDGTSLEHLSVFALAPIPLLVFLGRELSDKQQVDFFQRHRDTDDWKWKTSSAPVDYDVRRLRLGTVSSKVALCLSLSGPIGIESLPPTIDTEFTVYEIVPVGMPPSLLLLQQKADLQNFRVTYVRALREIVAAHQSLRELHLFPAIPAPFALVCGHALLPKVDPTLLVYDADKAKGGFTLALTVN